VQPDRATSDKRMTSFRIKASWRSGDCTDIFRVSVIQSL
jgi:hypothetical protein